MIIKKTKLRLIAAAIAILIGAPAVVLSANYEGEASLDSDYEFIGLIDNSGNITYTEEYIENACGENQGALDHEWRERCENWSQRQNQGVDINHGDMSFERCIIDNVPGSNNSNATLIAARHCQKYPRYTGPKKAEMLGPKTVYECSQKYAASTLSKRTAGLIIKSCMALYPED